MFLSTKKKLVRRKVNASSPAKSTQISPPTKKIFKPVSIEEFPDLKNFFEKDALRDILFSINEELKKGSLERSSLIPTLKTITKLLSVAKTTQLILTKDKRGNLFLATKNNKHNISEKIDYNFLKNLIDLVNAHLGYQALITRNKGTWPLSKYGLRYLGLLPPNISIGDKPLLSIKLPQPVQQFTTLDALYSPMDLKHLDPRSVTIRPFIRMLFYNSWVGNKTYFTNFSKFLNMDIGAGTTNEMWTSEFATAELTDAFSYDPNLKYFRDYYISDHNLLEERLPTGGFYPAENSYFDNRNFLEKFDEYLSYNAFTLYLSVPASQFILEEINSKDYQVTPTELKKLFLDNIQVKKVAKGTTRHKIINTPEILLLNLIKFCLKHNLTIDEILKVINVEYASVLRILINHRLNYPVKLTAHQFLKVHIILSKLYKSMRDKVQEDSSLRYSLPREDYTRFFIEARRQLSSVFHAEINDMVDLRGTLARYAWITPIPDELFLLCKNDYVQQLKVSTYKFKEEQLKEFRNKIKPFELWKKRHEIMFERCKLQKKGFHNYVCPFLKLQVEVADTECFHTSSIPLGRYLMYFIKSETLYFDFLEDIIPGITEYECTPVSSPTEFYKADSVESFHLNQDLPLDCAPNSEFSKICTDYNEYFYFSEKETAVMAEFQILSQFIRGILPYLIGLKDPHNFNINWSPKLNSALLGYVTGSLLQTLVGKQQPDPTSIINSSIPPQLVPKQGIFCSVNKLMSEYHMANAVDTQYRESTLGKNSLYYVSKRILDKFDQTNLSAIQAKGIEKHPNYEKVKDPFSETENAIELVSYKQFRPSALSLLYFIDLYESMRVGIDLQDYSFMVQLPCTKDDMQIYTSPTKRKANGDLAELRRSKTLSLKFGKDYTRVNPKPYGYVSPDVKDLPPYLVKENTALLFLVRAKNLIHALCGIMSHCPYVAILDVKILPSKVVNDVKLQDENRKTYILNNRNLSMRNFQKGDPLNTNKPAVFDSLNTLTVHSNRSKTDMSVFNRFKTFFEEKDQGIRMYQKAKKYQEIILNNFIDNHFFPFLVLADEEENITKLLKTEEEMPNSAEWQQWRKKEAYKIREDRKLVRRKLNLVKKSI